MVDCEVYVQYMQSTVVMVYEVYRYLYIVLVQVIVRQYIVRLAVYIFGLILLGYMDISTPHKDVLLVSIKTKTAHQADVQKRHRAPVPIPNVNWNDLWCP